ncbi:hypothetical protein AXG93_1655s1000 [Marchantia polymorpha subsp. ruderalis]|uniref:Uncharacterized protein n=1 Tax=Marchantia polymorpha subsp. ruderalis TaxID=1480154 RepID=A0A176W142_MARPO|nr:hypothetical protein AXG93_1655s1000 [Marchantia polymorpha subsp. ruderalis]
MQAHDAAVFVGDYVKLASDQEQKGISNEKEMALSHGKEHGGTEEALGDEKEQWEEEEGSEDGLGEVAALEDE